MADFPPALLEYFAKREAQRTAAVEEFLDGLTEYERGLFYDAAVMGYVRGSMHPRDQEIPLNKPIVADVVNACFAFADLYPTVNAEFEDRRTTVEYFVQSRQSPDDNWEQASSTTTDPAAVVEWRDSKRRMLPDFEYRVARRVTRVIVQAERAEEPQ